MKTGVRWFYTHKTFIWSHEAEQEDRENETTAEECTMREFTKMASCLTDCLEFTWDAPFKHKGGKMPVLDTQIWVGLNQREWSNPGGFIVGEIPFYQENTKRIILYEFYRKPISNDTPLNARTAAPTKQLMQTCVYEYKRRLRNTSRHLPENTINSVLIEYTTD